MNTFEAERPWCGRAAIFREKELDITPGTCDNAERVGQTIRTTITRNGVKMLDGLRSITLQDLARCHFLEIC